jgi:hypothetical protein
MSSRATSEVLLVAAARACCVAVAWPTASLPLCPKTSLGKREELSAHRAITTLPRFPTVAVGFHCRANTRVGAEHEETIKSPNQGTTGSPSGVVAGLAVRMRRASRARRGEPRFARIRRLPRCTTRGAPATDARRGHCLGLSATRHRSLTAGSSRITASAIAWRVASKQQQRVRTNTGHVEGKNSNGRIYFVSSATLV